MATTWGDIKNEYRDSFRDTTQSFINDNELLRMAKRVLRLVDSHGPYGFSERSATITLNGASSYDISTTLPDFKQLITLTYTPSGSTIPIEFEYRNLKDFEISRDTYVYTLQGSSTLRFYAPGVVSLTGTIGIDYYSRYLALNGTTLVEYPTSDTSTFIIPERYVDIVTEGLLMLAWRKDRSHREDYTDAKEMFERRLTEMTLTEPVRVSKPLRFVSAAF
jgi:hypothetical protein